MEIAKYGKTVYAVDQSENMLSKLKEKIVNSEEKIFIIKSAMEDFKIEAKCGLCICRDAFFHNLTPESQRNTLRNIKNSLDDDGEFCFNIHYPSHKYLSWLDSDDAKKYKERAIYKIPGSENQIRISQALFADFRHQIVETKLKYETLSDKNECIKEEYSGWISRYTYPYEMFYLLELEGFSVNNVYGNYNKEKYDINTMLIIEAKKCSI